jgi:hypothetical protein
MRFQLNPPNEPTNQQQYDRAKCGNRYRAWLEASRCYCAPSESRSNEAADERAYDSQYYGDYAAGRVTPWHQKLRESPGYETQQNPVKPERHRPTVSPGC